MDGDENKFHQNMDNMLKHYHNDRFNFASESRFKNDYISSRILLTDSAINLLTNGLHSTDIYRNPKQYVHHMDPFFCGTFNNVWINFRSHPLQVKKQLGNLSLKWKCEEDNNHLQI